MKNLKAIAFFLLAFAASSVCNAQAVTKPKATRDSLSIDTDDAVTFARSTLSGDSAAYGTAADALDVTGLVDLNRTETVADQSRPVAWDLDLTASPASALGQSTDFHGIDLTLTTGSANLNSRGRLYPFESTASYTGTVGNLDLAVAGYFQVLNTGTTMDEARGLRIWVRNNGTGTLTTAKGIHIDTPEDNGTITTAYGIYIDNVNTGATNFAIYSNGGNSYFAGSMEVAGTLTVGNGGIKLYDSGSDHTFTITTTDNATSNRTLTINPGDANRTLTMLGDCTVNQNLATTSAPTFARISLDKTITAAGTTGAQTINKSAGSVNLAASAASLVVTSSVANTSSVIICTVGTNDATCKSVQAVAGSGSFTIYPDAAPTAETRVNFLIIN